MKNQLLPKGKLLSSLLSIAVLSSITAKAQTLTWYQDLDGDGWGNPNVSITSATQPTGYVLNSLDCNDNSANTSEWYYVDSMNLASNINYSDKYDIAITGNDVYLLYRGSGTISNSYGYYLMKYDGTGFTNESTLTTVSTMHISHPRIAKGPNNSIYVCYNDPINGDSLTVKKYDGNNWTTIGSPGFSHVSPIYHNFTVSPNGTPYVIYADPISSHNATVMYYNGNAWVTAGSIGAIPGNTYHYEVAASNSNLYISFEFDAGTGSNDNIQVWEYASNSWSIIGSPFALPSGVTDQYTTSSLIISNNDLYLLRRDESIDGKATLNKYSSNSWSTVGNAGFSDSTIYDPSIAIDGAGDLYAMYGDETFPTLWLTMKKYDGITWDQLATPFVSFATAFGSAMDVGINGVPFALFKDNNVNGNPMAVRSLRPVSGSVLADIPSVTAQPDTIFQGDTTVLTVSTGDLNDATYWQWYTDSCGGTKVSPVTSNSDNSVITVKPLITTTYYVRGEGNCVNPSGCKSITVVVNFVSASSIKANELDVSLYPNPNNGVFTLKGNIGHGVNSTKVTMLNSLGQVVYQNVLNANNGAINERVELSAEVPTGNYIMSFDIDGKLYYKNISIQ